MIWIILAIAAWGVIHSWLASLEAKEAMRGRLGESAMRLYRLAYNVFSVLSFIPVLLLVGLLPDGVLYVMPSPWRYLMIAGQLLSILCIVLALLQVDAASFIGIRQVIHDERASQLVTGGFYRWVRHPLYLFGLLILWLTPAMTRNLLVAFIALSLYLIIGAMFEERKLLREFGPPYAEYRARTPMLIPFVKSSPKVANRPRATD